MHHFGIPPCYKYMFAPVQHQVPAAVQGSADAQAGSAQRESVLAIVNALAEEEAELQHLRRPQPGDYLVSKSWLMCARCSIKGFYPRLVHSWNTLANLSELTSK